MALVLSLVLDIAWQSAPGWKFEQPTWQVYWLQNCTKSLNDSINGSDRVPCKPDLRTAGPALPQHMQAVHRTTA